MFPQRNSNFGEDTWKTSIPSNLAKVLSNSYFKILPLEPIHREKAVA